MNKLTLLQQTCQDKEHNDIDLNLGSICINIFTIQIKNYIQNKLPNVVFLCLADCQLVSLQHLPYLDLVTLELQLNFLQDSQLKRLRKFQYLTKLELSENLLENPKNLQVLNKLKHLKHIFLEGNQYKGGYISQVFMKLPQLEQVDYKDRQNQDYMQNYQNNQLLQEQQQQNQEF